MRVANSGYSRKRPLPLVIEKRVKLRRFLDRRGRLGAKPGHQGEKGAVENKAALHILDLSLLVKGRFSTRNMPLSLWALWHLMR